MGMKRVVVLGSTGSIGTQTLDVLQHYPEHFQVTALAAGQNTCLLAKQIAVFQPTCVSVGSMDARETLLETLKHQGSLPAPEVFVGQEGLEVLSQWPEADSIVVGLSGFQGLLPTLRALETGKQVLTANKETLVAAGHLVKPYLSQLLPLDSEHAAIFHCLQDCRNPQSEVAKIYLTASGGSFRDYPIEALQNVTITEALHHPNWVMGQKVTIDSATMMNKGLERIEAQHLFQLPLEKIDIVIHPQSIVHSAVGFIDGSMLAQLGEPDMRIPIQYGLTWPEHWAAPPDVRHLDLTQLGQLDFFPPDSARYPCLALAQFAAERGGSMPVVLNAADEMAVEAFLSSRISFLDIPRSIETLLEAHQPYWEPVPNLEQILAADRWARQKFTETLSTACMIVTTG